MSQQHPTPATASATPVSPDRSPLQSRRLMGWNRGKLWAHKKSHWERQTIARSVPSTETDQGKGLQEPLTLIEFNEHSSAVGVFLWFGVKEYRPKANQWRQEKCNFPVQTETERRDEKGEVLSHEEDSLTSSQGFCFLQRISHSLQPHSFPLSPLSC